MPNHVKNKIEFICNNETMKNIYKKYNTYYPPELHRAYNNNIICRKINSDIYSVGWFDERSGIFFTREAYSEERGLPEGWEFEIKEEYNHFPDFNKIIPQPKNIFNNNLGEKEREMCKREGKPNWYDWNIANWGAKWNSYKCDQLEDNIFIFETAWSKVDGIVRKISQDFPDSTIIYTYADEDTGYNCGRMIFENGEIIDSFIPKGGIKEAYDIAFELRPHYKDNYIFDGNNYIYNEEE